MSRRNRDCLDSTSHESSKCTTSRRAPPAIHRTRSLVPMTSSSSSVCEASPQRKSKNKIQWTRRTPLHAGRGMNITDHRSLPSQTRLQQPQSLGEILRIVGRPQNNGRGGDGHDSSQQLLQNSSRSVVSAGSRVSFAKELEEVHDIPEYDNESRTKCFYSNRDLSEFRCEWEMEQDGLMPMQR
ncbi:hypothetical protein IV203_016080 [Nitzschia inconspicua]|uniref:Uncharacterized protein n=1 Tax=Nitzschia inconspicua TaxID=303405 RepID=A0A9K3KPD6_9STRA|nr:hypothetical protein IV203_016080 [Nitzschia inconspicua]